MILKLDIERVRTIDEVRDFMTGSEPVDFHLTERRGAYDFVTRTLRRLNYAGLSKADKEGGRASLCGEGHGVVAGTEHAADWSVPEHWAHPGPALRCDAPV